MGPKLFDFDETNRSRSCIRAEAVDIDFEAPFFLPARADDPRQRIAGAEPK